MLHRGYDTAIETLSVIGEPCALFAFYYTGVDKTIEAALCRGTGGKEGLLPPCGLHSSPPLLTPHA